MVTLNISIRPSPALNATVCSSSKKLGHIKPEFHKFCNSIYTFMLSLELRDKIVVNKEQSGYKGDLTKARSYYIPFQVLYRGALVESDTLNQIRISNHAATPKHGERIVDFVIHDLDDPAEYKRKLAEVKYIIKRFIEPSTVPKKIASSQKEVPNATAVGKVMYKKMKDLGFSTPSFERTSNGSVIRTSEVELNLARYGPKLRINFIYPGEEPLFREIRKTEVNEIIDQILKWLSKDGGLP